MLGTLFATDPDRARVYGFFIHLLNGQVFALFYAATFALLGRASVALGAELGLLHAAVALTILVPLLPGVHPRMASKRAGPSPAGPRLEAPGLLGRNRARDGDRRGHGARRVRGGARSSAAALASRTASAA